MSGHQIYQLITGRFLYHECLLTFPKNGMPENGQESTKADSHSIIGNAGLSRA